MNHFKKDCPENNGNSTQIVLEGYNDADVLVVSNWGDKEGDVSQLGVMHCRAVDVWRDVKHSTSAWRGDGKNTHGHFGKTEVRIRMISLSGGVAR